jgi:hypothetical protein
MTEFAELNLLADMAEKFQYQEEKRVVYELIQNLVLTSLPYRIFLYRYRGEWGKVLELSNDLDNRLRMIMEKLEKRPDLVEDQIKIRLHEWKQLTSDLRSIAHVELYWKD